MHENGIRTPDGIANMVSTDLSAPAVRTLPLALALPLPRGANPTPTPRPTPNPNGPRAERLAARTPLAPGPVVEALSRPF